ncbi:hypothetical protein BS78_03G098400 [Paspalum vaginatum]|nr:hypothetical protein BS78_03G098400 [Paspalum vaginatum]
MPRRRRGRRCSSQAAPPRALEDDDLLADILLRLPPHPSTLACAAAVCRGWRRLVTDPGFLNRFRARHRKLPLLGVFMNSSGYPIFRSTLDPPDPILPKRLLPWRNEDGFWYLLGVRHGRVLIFNESRREYLVWDPSTCDRRCVAAPPMFDGKERFVCSGAVLCLAGEQGHAQHGECHSGPFQLVLIGVGEDERRVFACVYSSQSNEWGSFSSAAIRYMDSTFDASTLVGNSLYWLFEDIEGGILEFDLGTQSLNILENPPDMDTDCHNYQIILPEDGVFGIAALRRFSFDIWERKVGHDGAASWVLLKTVKLEEITGLSRDERGHMIIHGYDEEDNVIFPRTDIGCFQLELESMKYKNLGKSGFINTSAYYPYRSLYTNKGFTLGYQMAWNDCIEAFEKQKLIVQDVLKSVDCKISLTADTLTATGTMGHMCITCHFISADWKVEKRIIKFFVLEAQHNGVDIFSAVLRCIQDWNIEQRLFGITIGNSVANDTMAGMLKHNLVLKNVVPVEGKLLHNHCASHVINVFVSDGLNFVDSIVCKLRESVKYIRSSKSRSKNFEKIVAQEGISAFWPSLDMPTRWSSTYCLIETALEFRRVFDSLASQDANYTYAPSFEEWERIGVVCRLLDVCHEATMVISCSSCHTSNFYFHEIWNIKLTLDREASGVDNNVRKMIKEMKRKFNNYWKKSYISLSIPIIFDPRFKYAFVEFRFKQAFGADAGKYLRRVQKVLRGLYNEYSSQSNDCNVDFTGGDQDMSMADNGPFADWIQYLSSNVEVLPELDRYLNESPTELSEDFDILNWWMVYTPVYPTLARIARDVLAVPASTVASEWVFNTGGRAIGDFHNRLTPETVEALICLRDWCKDSGYHPSRELATEFIDILF